VSLTLSRFLYLYRIVNFGPPWSSDHRESVARWKRGALAYQKAVNKQEMAKAAAAAAAAAAVSAAGRRNDGCDVPVQDPS